MIRGSFLWFILNFPAAHKIEVPAQKNTRRTKSAGHFL
jgi:hypothetical protein